jgi:hypothetical protein
LTSIPDGYIIGARIKRNRQIKGANKVKATALLKQVIETENDFEWYPTTPEIIDTIKNDIGGLIYCHGDPSPSVLDCGAGDGRVLDALTVGDKYAIEKSRPLIDALNPDIFIVGTDFLHQTLIDKKVEVVFSNPPYSEYELWSAKIIREANAKVVYLVIPERWKQSKTIADAVAVRDAKVTELGSFDFLNAERAARAKVQIIRVLLGFEDRHYGNASPKIDPFRVWFDDFFSINADKTKNSEYGQKQTQKEKLSQALVTGGDLIQTLYELYEKELETLIATYKKIESIDPVLLQHMDINLKSVCESLRLKITGLKDLYWKELFDNLSKITDRLTHSSRSRLLDTLNEHTHIDFSPSNAYAIVTWVIKNANKYYDDQLVELVETMIGKANIKLYKSNQKTFGEESWRYGRRPDNLGRFQLDYRVVLDRIGGLVTDRWYLEYQSECGLSERATKFLNDIRTVASNLGFLTNNHPSVQSLHWSSRKNNSLLCKDIYSGKDEVLFEASAYKNGNVHIKFNQKFLRRLNVEFGRLKGWIKSPKEAVKEMDIPLGEATQAFNSNLRLEASSVLRLESFTQR